MTQAHCSALLLVSAETDGAYQAFQRATGRPELTVRANSGERRSSEMLRSANCQWVPMAP
jgi:hypothetical protein